MKVCCLSIVLVSLIPFVSTSSLRRGHGDEERELQNCPGGCPKFSNCVFDDDGNTKCQCVPGTVEIRGQCYIVNECLQWNPCPEFSECINYDPPIQFQCKCQPGYLQLGSDEFGATDCGGGCPIDCPRLTDCMENGAGGFECVCPEGARWEGDKCVDINECVEENACGFVGAYCVDQDPPTKYVCDCLPGYDSGYEHATDFSPQGIISCDLDECAKPELNECHPDATCVNLIRVGYRCECNEGFRGNGRKCEPIPDPPTPAPSEYNPCQDANCNPFQQVCVIKPNGRTVCECNDFWISPSGYGGACVVDVDECREGAPQVCPDNAVCVNIPGSYFCYCEKGYHEVRGQCEDNDECAISNPCVGGQVCVNRPGSFECVAP